MALDKKIIINNQTITYWSINSIEINYVAKSSTIIIGGFTTKDDKDMGHNHILTHSFYFNGDDFPFNKNDKNVIKTAYEKIIAFSKENENVFSDATNV